MDGIYELRTPQGSDITRLLYFFFEDNRAIVTNGFEKKDPAHAEEGNREGEAQQRRLEVAL